MNSCIAGFSCARGTSRILKESQKCRLNQFCPSGSISSKKGISHCPLQTKSDVKSSHILNCEIREVNVCDKADLDPKDPLSGLSYYPQHKYKSLADNSLLVEFSSSGNYNRDSELAVVRKINPIDSKSNSQFWKNDTIEVFRSCPSYGFMNKSENVTIFGRNFRDSAKLTCRFTLCLGSNQSLSNSAVEVAPGKCIDTDLRSTRNTHKLSAISKGKYISQTRVSCPLPKLVHNESITSSSLSSPRCKKDRNGIQYYMQKCNEKEYAAGACNEAFDVEEIGHKRHYSIAIPCTQNEIHANICDNIPESNMKLNPCLSYQILIDISNNGFKFTGDTTYVPHSVGLDIAQFNNHKDFGINPTFGVYNQINFNFFESTNIKTILSDLEDMEKMDSSLCDHPLYGEENDRRRESGWFELPFLREAHLQIDWRHLPLDLEYDEHYRLAIFVRPSRCENSKCNSDRARQPNEETVPCMQPVKLPEWFLNPNVNKHQILNLTMLSLEDSIFKVEVHILHGLFLSSSPFFLNTLSVEIREPSRAKTKVQYDTMNNTKLEKRTASPYVSWEEKEVDLEHFFGILYTSTEGRSISQPLNMPPRWSNFSHGRVLLSMNTTIENPTPTIKESSSTLYTSEDFWMNPFITPGLAKEETDTYFETFHGVQVQANNNYKYDHNELILPYLPFFSNCREFDSYIPIWSLVESSQCRLPVVDEDFKPDWWRRAFPPLPHMDDIESVGPFDFSRFFPIADWCERELKCSFEEDLEQPDITPRWFEADAGTSLFSIIRDPINYYQYTGRGDARNDADDGGGQKYIKTIKSSDTFIPVKVDRSDGDEIDGGCDILCYPRKMILDISYYQVDKNVKRIVSSTLFLENFDKNSSNSAYKLEVKFRPLDYKQLIVQFAYSRGIFVLLFIMIGVGTCIMAFLYWIVVRLTTQIESPPSIRFVGMLWLIFPQALFGVFVALVPITILTALILFVLKGFQAFSSDTESDAFDGFFKEYPLHYQDSNIMPEALNSTRQGRVGLAFIAIATICILEGSKIFIPNRQSRRKKKVSNFESNKIVEKTTWMSNTWKRSNLIYTSFIMSLFLVIIVEWSFWGGFGIYIWEAIIALKVMNILASNIVEKQLDESLLCAPIMTSMGMIQGLVTLSAVDFMDFLLSYIVEFGFLILERMYTDPYQSMVFEWVSERFAKLILYGKKKLIEIKILDPSYWKIGSKGDKTEVDAIQEGGATVEPIIESYGSYCCDTASLLYTPYIILLLMILRDETEIPTIYGIKEQDMEYYLTFALVIIPFQITTDILIHSSQELFHGWKIYDYLVYARYRFLQRETRWKGIEDSLDECIDENLRTLDQMCFSSQFYMMLILHVNGIVYLVLGIEMMVRAKYNLFGDPVMPLLIPFVFLSSFLIKNIMICIGKVFNIWKVRHKNTAWHVAMRSENAEEMDIMDVDISAGYEEYLMNQRIISETFRYKFLNYNRSWIIDQLPSVLTPRTLRRSQPYLINQFTKILNSLNDDISSDSDLDTEAKYKMPALDASSRKLLRSWLSQAQHRLKRKQVVQPLTQKTRGTHCEQCLSLKQLQVETLFTIDEM